MVPLKQFDHSRQLGAAAWNRRACRKRLIRIRGCSVLGLELCRDSRLISVLERAAHIVIVFRFGAFIHAYPVKTYTH